MESVFIEIIKAFSSQGITGIALFLVYSCIVALVVFMYLHSRNKILQLHEQLMEFKVDREQLVQLVKNNTSALVKNTVAVEHCSQVIHQNNRMLQRIIDGFYVQKRTV